MSGPPLLSRPRVGVLAVRPTDSNRYLTTEQRQLLEAYSGLAALAIEVMAGGLIKIFPILASPAIYP